MAVYKSLFLPLIEQPHEEQSNGDYSMPHMYSLRLDCSRPDEDSSRIRMQSIRLWHGEGCRLNLVLISCLRRGEIRTRLKRTSQPSSCSQHDFTSQCWCGCHIYGYGPGHWRVRHAFFCNWLTGNILIGILDQAGICVF